MYLKLTDQQASDMVTLGISQLFGGTPTKFEQYTYAVLDEDTGEKYWLVENVQYDGVVYDVLGWIRTNYPELTEYSDEFVSQFIPKVYS